MLYLMTLKIVQNQVEETELSKILCRQYCLCSYPVCESIALGPNLSLLMYLQHHIQYSSVEPRAQRRTCSIEARFPFNEHKYQSLPPPENSKSVCFTPVFFKSLSYIESEKFVEHSLFCSNDFCVPDLE